MLEKILAALALSVSATPAMGAAPLQISTFEALPQAQQLDILDASYNAVVAQLGFEQADTKGSPPVKKLFSRLTDRDAKWVAQALNDYMGALQKTPTSLGAAVTQALWFRCGALTVEAHG